MTVLTDRPATPTARRSGLVDAAPTLPSPRWAGPATLQPPAATEPPAAKQSPTADQTTADQTTADQTAATLPAATLATDQPQPAVLTVSIFADLDIATVAQVRARLDEAMDRRPDRLVVDLTRCDFVDATALAMLLDAHRRCARRGASFTLAGCGPRVLRVLSLTGLQGVFDLG